MKLQISLFFILFLFAGAASAAPMSRVVRVIDPQTIAVESLGVVTNVRLAGVEITDARNALALLSWALDSSCVLVENGLIYRSPDGLLVNRELVAKGFAVSTAPETATFSTTRGVYLGEAAPGKTSGSARAADPAPPARALPPRRATRRAKRAAPRVIRSRK